MNVGAIHFVEMADGVDYDGRLLRGGRAVHVYEGPTVDGLLEDGEILADFLDVESGC